MKAKPAVVQNLSLRFRYRKTDQLGTRHFLVVNSSDSFKILFGFQSLDEPNRYFQHVDFADDDEALSELFI